MKLNHSTKAFVAANILERVDFRFQLKENIKPDMVIWYPAWKLLITFLLNKNQEIFHDSLSEFWLINVSRALLTDSHLYQPLRIVRLLLFLGAHLPPSATATNNDLFSFLLLKDF